MQPGYQSPYGAPARPDKKFPVWLIVLIVVLGVGALIGGTLVILAISGTRRYLALAKTAEAKNSIGAIARAARAAYEREQVDGTHKLCASAIAVPAKVPSGTKYQPSSASGADFETGDEQTGWRCLKFAITQPIYYQYQYRQGSGYVGKPAPAADGFEASARGDLDGDGDLSLFALGGSVVNSDVVMSPSVYVENEVE
jgi:type IV pilus assembly protein PilA